jgi:hypothetical protein
VAKFERRNPARGLRKTIEREPTRLCGPYTRTLKMMPRSNIHEAGIGGDRRRYRFAKGAPQLRQGSLK